MPKRCTPGGGKLSDNRLSLSGLKIMEKEEKIKISKSGKANNPFTQERILNIIKEYNSAIPRDVICEELNIPWTTAYDNLFKLEKEGKVERSKESNGKVGRPLVLWGLNLI